MRFRTGAQALVEALVKSGVDTVFGYPGGNVLDIFEGLRQSPIRFILARHEQGAVHMADGYARASGRPGVVLVTSGPGLTNSITGLGCANMDGVPLVLICGQVELGRIGTDAFQEADTTGLTRGVSKHNFLVHSADELPATVAESFYIATHGKPGAVVIDVPCDIQRERTTAAYPERVSLRAYHPECAATPKEVAALIDCLKAAKRPLVYVGGGVIAAGASAELGAFVHRTGVPVVASLMGLGALDSADPQFLGMTGVYGETRANAAFARADFILALGVRFNDRVTEGVKFARGAKLVQVDCDPSAIDKNVRVTLGITADIRELLVMLSAAGGGTPALPAWANAPWLESSVGRAALCPPAFGLTDAAVVAAVNRLAQGSAIAVTDVGNHQLTVARHWHHVGARRFLTSGGMGAMGFGIPAAIGAALARPGERVVAFLGDGGAQMTAEELGVAAELSLPIVLVVLNNRQLGMIASLQREYWVGDYSVPDFVTLAKAYGIRGLRVASAAQLERTLRRAFRSSGPVLVEVRTASVRPQ